MFEGVQGGLWLHPLDVFSSLTGGDKSLKNSSILDEKKIGNREIYSESCLFKLIQKCNYIKNLDLFKKIQNRINSTFGDINGDKKN